MRNRLIYKIFNRLYNIYQAERYRLYYNKYALPSSFKFNGPDITVYGDGRFIAGADSYIGSYSTVQIANGNKVQIGKGCRISHNVRMYTRSLEGDSDLSDPQKQIAKTGDIIIGDWVWIGANVFINPGVTIGDHSVIGANSVVTKDIEPYAIVGGVPAKLIRFKKGKPG
jgi:maltose O-acetyltransferase